MPDATRFRLFAGVLAALVFATAAVLFGVGFLAAQRGTNPAPVEGSVYRVPVHGVVELGLAPFIARSLREAEAAGARAVILHIETPGGRIDAAEQIVDAIKNTQIPVYAFVDRRAFSAGALIALATDGIFMRPGGVIGAATPVTGEGDRASEKIVSAMRSEMRALAEDRGLDGRIAEAMVDEDVAIDGVIEAGKLLTLTSEEAERLDYARVAEDLDAVLAAVNMSGAHVHETDVNWAESLVRIFTHPVVAPMLLSLGFLGLLVEIKTPAFGLAGLAGLGSLSLFFGSHYLVGLAGMEELLLIAGGLALLGLEVFVIPGFGIAGVAGITALGAGIVMSLIGSFATGADIAQAFGVLSLSAIVVVVAAWALIRRLPGSGRFSRSGLLLRDEMTRETGYLSAAVRPDLIGRTGVALTDLRPAGAARIGEERFDVTAEPDWIEAGTPIRIIRSDGYRLVVQVDDTPST